MFIFFKDFKLLIKIHYMNIVSVIWERSWQGNKTRTGMLASVYSFRITETTKPQRQTIRVFPRISWIDR